VRFLSVCTVFQYEKPIGVPPIKPKRRQQRFNTQVTSPPLWSWPVDRRPDPPPTVPHTTPTRPQEAAEKKHVHPGPRTTHSTVDRQIHLATFAQYAGQSAQLIHNLFLPVDAKKAQKN